MSAQGRLSNILQMDLENEMPVQVLSKARGDDQDLLGRRQRCGCLRTSEKLRRLLGAFPAPPPPTPAHLKENAECVSAHCKMPYHPIPLNQSEKKLEEFKEPQQSPAENSNVWRIITELVQIVELAVTATALAMYYIIYCYMQLVYYTLRSALYFHHADGPMKITIGVVCITSVVIAFNLIVRLEKLLRIFQ